MSPQNATGFRLGGIDERDFCGGVIAGAGDVNGDGIDDLIIGAPDADPGGRDGAGESYVVFGSSAGFAASLDLSTLDGTNGFRVDGIDGEDGSGRSVAGAGDVNGDGIDDLIIGAPGADPGERYTAGASYVVFGSAAGFEASLDLSGLDGTNGFRLDGIDPIDTPNYSGSSVAGAGDVNGDGIDDLIIGAPLAESGTVEEGAGESYVVFGTTAGFVARFDLAALNGTNGFRLRGIGLDANSGSSVAGARDVNGDGIDDLIIGAPSAHPGEAFYAGESYVVFGTTAGFPASLDLSALDGRNGFRLDGIDMRDFSGSSVAGAGDVNGDGINDLIIGASSASPGGRYHAGESYVVFGTTAGFPASLDFSALDGSNGFRLVGIEREDHSGSSVAGAGDVNGDGFDDVIVGAPDGGRAFAGESYVVFGSAAGFAARLRLATLDGTNGLRFDGGRRDASGGAVAGAGDVNGDGIDDLMIGASAANADGKAYAGESYIIFGGVDRLGRLDRISGVDGAIKLSDVGALVGTDLGEAMSGTSADDILCGFGGADTLLGQLGADVLRGGVGADSLNGGGNWDEIYGGWGDDLIDGRLGRDLLHGNRGSDTLLAGGADDTLVGGLGADMLTGGTGNDVFVFRSGSESSGSERDTLKADTAAPAFDAPGAIVGDVIDLSLVDADATTIGDQAFAWSGRTPGGRGSLWLSNDGALTIVKGNVDNDRTAELTIAIEDGSVLASAYTENDFLA